MIRKILDIIFLKSEAHKHEFEWARTLEVRPVDQMGIYAEYREVWACRCGKEEIRTTVAYI